MCNDEAAVYCPKRRPATNASPRRAGALVHRGLGVLSAGAGGARDPAAGISSWPCSDRFPPR
eukprot:1185225-Prorocentrum_minimum.AAC.2